MSSNPPLPAAVKSTVGETDPTFMAEASRNERKPVTIEITVSPVPQAPEDQPKRFVLRGAALDRPGGQEVHHLARLDSAVLEATEAEVITKAKEIVERLRRVLPSPPYSIERIILDCPFLD